MTIRVLAGIGVAFITIALIGVFGIAAISYASHLLGVGALLVGIAVLVRG